MVSNLSNVILCTKFLIATLLLIYYFYSHVLYVPCYICLIIYLTSSFLLWSEWARSKLYQQEVCEEKSRIRTNCTLIQWIFFGISYSSNQFPVLIGQKFSVNMVFNFTLKLAIISKINTINDYVYCKYTTDTKYTHIKHLTLTSVHFQNSIERRHISFHIYLSEFFVNFDRQCKSKHCIWRSHFSRESK